MKVKDYLRSRQQSYRQTFKGIFGEYVLQDLAKFCQADESTFHTDARIEGIMQGRREVWLRISKHLNLSDEQLHKYFNPGGDTE